MMAREDNAYIDLTVSPPPKNGILKVVKAEHVQNEGPAMHVKTEDKTVGHKRRWATRMDAVTALKLESTKVGRRIKTMNSCSRAVTLVCHTHGQVYGDTRFGCQYKVVLRKSKSTTGRCTKKPWAIKKGLYDTFTPNP